MSDVRMRYNFDEIRALEKSERARAIVVEKAEAMGREIVSRGGMARTDSQIGAHRARAAVIAGYEDGATAESTREQLLGALDSG